MAAHPKVASLRLDWFIWLLFYHFYSGKDLAGLPKAEGGWGPVKRNWSPSISHPHLFLGQTQSGQSKDQNYAGHVQQIWDIFRSPYQDCVEKPFLWTQVFFFTNLKRKSRKTGLQFQSEENNKDTSTWLKTALRCFQMVRFWWEFCPRWITSNPKENTC